MFLCISRSSSFKSLSFLDPAAIMMSDEAIGITIATKYMVPMSIWNCWELTEPFPVVSYDSSSSGSGRGPDAVNTRCSEAAGDDNDHIFTHDWNSFVDQVISDEKPKDYQAVILSAQQSMILSFQPHQKLTTHQYVTFHLASRDQEDSWTIIKDYSILIIGPSGGYYPILQWIRLSKDRMACLFRPLEPGMYVIHGLLNDVFHIQGSPFSVNISRDYSTSNIRPIITIEMEHKLLEPWGICCNTKTEQLFVVDGVHHNVLVFGPDGTFIFQFRGQGDNFRPTALAYDSNQDRILVSNKDNHEIQIFKSEDGEFISAFGSRGEGTGQFMFPCGIAVSRDGSLIVVADSKNHRIQLFTSEGMYIRHFCITDGWKLKDKRQKLVYPRTVAFNISGDRVYVSDYNQRTLYQIDINCTFCTRLLDFGIVKRPSGVTVDDVGNILICDSLSCTVRIFMPNGLLVGNLDNVGCPVDMTLMKAGFLAILDLNGHVTII